MATQVLQFKKAVKSDGKLRLAFCGPAGSGKTYSSLSVATGLGCPIAVVDTEHGSASKYADLFTFDVIEPAEFDPRELTKMIREAAEVGYKVIVIDSLSHYWMGKGGELEMVDNAVKRSSSGNSFAAWKNVTPVHNELVDTIIGTPIHVIVTMRSKTEWVIENVNGKNVPRKIGLAPVMRDGIEFEFDVCGDLDQDNTFTITKSRCPQLSGKSITRPGKELAKTLKLWLAGAPAETVPIPTTPVPTVVQRPVETQQASVGGPVAEMLVRFSAADKYGKLAEFQRMKADFIELLGEDQGEIAYYDVLVAHGVEKSDQFKMVGQSKRCAAAMQEKLINLASAPHDTAPENEGMDPDGDRDSWLPDELKGVGQ